MQKMREPRPLCRLWVLVLVSPLIFFKFTPDAVVVARLPFMANNKLQIYCRLVL